MLPADKHAELVFYCTNWLCTASHEAARRAVGAGYEDVSVMSDGIMGWAKAGEPTTLSTTTEGRSNS
jgi:rhodanese-related sulfurtransferase